ncbi:MAG: methyltransferase domain-containing protein [Caldilineaceae bacterium]
MLQPLPDYKNLDVSGEALAAARRMEARAQAPASAVMFATLVAPLLQATTRSVLEFGCGTAALARRIAHQAPQARVYASDKSEGMLAVARHLAKTEAAPNLQLAQWDVLHEAAFPFPEVHFDLIIASVVIPYFTDAETNTLIQRLAQRLAPGGILAFVEQDLATDSLNVPAFPLVRAVIHKEGRDLKQTLALGLRPLLREAGLQVLPRRSFLWTDEAYGPYTQDLLTRLADAATVAGRLTSAECTEWKQLLAAQAEAGDFYYGIVYHLVAGQRGGWETGDGSRETGVGRRE